jgi:hypothetical protein
MVLETGDLRVRARVCVSESATNHVIAERA